MPLDATIVIPTFNRCDALLSTLEAVARTDYDARSWEAVVVDDGSTDGTEEAVTAWLERSKAPVRYVRQANAGPARARNHGASLARGRALIFIDNDILVEPTFVGAHLAALDAHPGSWIVGRVTHPEQLRQTPFGRYRDAVWESFYEALPEDDVVETSAMTAANLSLPAEDFRRLGGFDEHFTIASSEDWELGMRARKAGIRILYSAAIVVIHNDWAITLDRFCERQSLYSVSDVLLWRKYGDSSPRIRLVQENAPIAWGREPLKLSARKAAKRILATPVGRRAVRIACGSVEQLAPDTAWCRRAYDAAVAVAIFRGVREGLARYGVGASGRRTEGEYP